MNKSIKELKRKAALCHQTSLKVRGRMRTIWQMKEKELLGMVEIIEAAEVLNRG